MPSTHPSPVPAIPPFLAGVDGGGTGTRVRLLDRQGDLIGQGQAGPSGLSQGVEQAWHHIGLALAEAFGAAGLPRAEPADIALGLGLAGTGRPEQRARFLALNPGHACCVLESDAATMLLGAHGGAAGIVVAAGTGSVAARRDARGQMQLAGGWGFPAGDEGSGAWLGLRAVQAAQAALDGRATGGALAQRVQAIAGSDAVALLDWCARAGQKEYATLAPCVFEAAAEGDAAARSLLQAAADELGRLAAALELPHTPLPVAFTGSIGERLQHLLPAALRARLVSPAGDSIDGALRLLRQHLAGQAPAHVQR